MKPLTSTNELDKSELREQLKAGKLTCAFDDCGRKATDVHHRDSNHSNDEPSNLAAVCKLCHNEVHGISANLSDLRLLSRLFYSVQRERVAASNQVSAYDRLGIETPGSHVALERAREFEAGLAKELEMLLRKEGVYAHWLSSVKGIGPLLAASLLGEIESPERFGTVSKLWSYCGLGINGDGQAKRRTKGEKSNWNAALKTTAWKLGCQFVKTGNSLGRVLYDKYRSYYEERDGEQPKWKVHKRALRRVAKDFLRCLWAAWRKELGLPVTEAAEGTWPMPDDWLLEVKVSELAVTPDDLEALAPHEHCQLELEAA